MDPNACLVRLLDACREDDREEAVSALDDLRAWIDDGGFLPRGRTVFIPDHRCGG